MKFNELEKHSFVEAPEELVKMVGECPSVFHTLLPYSQNPFFVKSKGYISLFIDNLRGML